MQALRNKVRYHMRRGLLELDIVLTRFAQSEFDNLTEEELKILDEMMQWEDPFLMEVLDNPSLAEEKYQPMIQKICSYRIQL